MSNDRKNKFVSIGYGNVVNSDRVLAVLSVSGHAAQRRLKIAEEQGKLIDGTCGRKTRAIIVLDQDGCVLTTGLNAQTLTDRLSGENTDDE